MDLHEIIKEMEEEIDIIDLKIIDKENDDYDTWVNKRIKHSISNYLHKLKKLNEATESEVKSCRGCIRAIHIKDSNNIKCLECINFDEKTTVTSDN